MHHQACSRRRLGQLLGGLALLAFAGCASRPAPGPRALKSAQAGSDIALFALSLLDKPYVSGGRGPVAEYFQGGSFAAAEFDNPRFRLV